MSTATKRDLDVLPYERGAIRRVRPSSFPEPAGLARGRARKVRPLDYLSSDERWAAAWLEKGGYLAEAVRSSEFIWRHREREAALYQIWLFDHREAQ